MHGKDRYVLEVPENALEHQPDDYHLKSQAKGKRRFWTPRIEEILSEIIKVLVLSTLQERGKERNRI